MNQEHQTQNTEQRTINTEQITKVEILKLLIVELSRHSCYRGSIYRKFKHIGDELIRLDSLLLQVEISHKEDMINKNKSLSVEKIDNYIKTGKYPSHLVSSMELMIDELLKVLRDNPVKLERFHRFEYRCFSIYIYDLLLTYDLIDKRRFMFLFKKSYALL